MIYKCPVCKGRGVVPQGFYNFSRGGTTTEIPPETCKSCSGKGVVEKHLCVDCERPVYNGMAQCDNCRLEL
jgi:DnaJ-class molecular chaperone